MRHARLSSLLRSGAAQWVLALMSVMFAGCIGPSAYAQSIGRGSGVAAPAADDGLGPRDLYLQADTLIDDRAHHTVVATGHVEARMQGRTLRTDRLVYNTVTGAAHAVGHAVVVNADGTSIYGQDVLLDDEFRAAVAYGFAAREQDNTTIVAAAAIRRNETVNQLNSAVYTPCNICAENGAPKSPTWSIRASRITQDRLHHVVYYRNAFVRILGVPVFFAPVFWHPDPTSPRRSGLLTPRIEYSRRRGFSYEQPYLQTLGPSTDLIISPQINSRVNPFVNLEYTQRFYSGLVDLRVGYTHSKEFDNQTFFNKDSSRSYILGRGLFNIQPDWVWGFGAERVTDPTLFARYAIHDVYTDRGPFPTDTDRLISQVFTQRQDQDTFISISALSFESLRAYGRVTAAEDPDLKHLNEVIGETNKAFPIAAPLIEARYDPTQSLFGGQLHVTANAVDLIRNNAIINVNDPSSLTVAGPQQYPGSIAGYLGGLSQLPIASTTNTRGGQQLTALTYSDARRVSAQVDWRRTFTLDNGIRIEPFIFGRGDLFSLTNSTLYTFGSNLTASSGTTVTAVGNTLVRSQPGDETITRGLPTIGANLSWPFIRPIGGASLVLEPLVQIAIAPSLRQNPNIPNEDSVAFEYDDTNLFSINRFAGYDLVESGQRLNVGGRATIDWGSGRNASFILGRTFRAEPDYAFTAASGLQGTSSDYVTAFTFTPLVNLSFFTRARLDADTLSVRQNETGFSVGDARLNVALRYNYNENGFNLTPLGADPATGLATGGAEVVQHTRDAQISGQAFFTQHWGVTANVSRDFSDQIHYPLEQIGLVYLDECIRVDILYTHDQTYSTTIGSSNAISFRLTLATLGNSSSVAQPRAGSR